VLALRDGGFNIILPTSVGKTVLAAALLFKTHIHGGNIGANLKLAWTQNEIGSMEDLGKQINTHI
jgi:hypothetical protein